jgi:hypothetical protein
MKNAKQCERDYRTAIQATQSASDTTGSYLLATARLVETPVASIVEAMTVVAKATSKNFGRMSKFIFQ